MDACAMIPRSYPGTLREVELRESTDNR